MSDELRILSKWFSWTSHPLICCAPMRTVAGVDLIRAVNSTGGLGFYGAGWDAASLPTVLPAIHTSLPRPRLKTPHPYGIGFLLWNLKLEDVLPHLKAYPPLAIWLFGWTDAEQLGTWMSTLKKEFPSTAIVVQIGSVAEARMAISRPELDILVVQGVADSGGHGISPGASLMTLLPEVADVVSAEAGRPIPLLAAGGIMDARGAAAALMLGAHGIVLGTALIATNESEAPQGFKEKVVNTCDGGQTTIRTRLYDELRGTAGWPQHFVGRAVINDSYVDANKGMNEEKNKELYQRAVENQDFERLTTFAGTGIGLVKSVRPASSVVSQVRNGARELLAAKAKQWE